VLGPLGFVERGRHFAHPDSRFFVEFPTGPLMVGDQRVRRVSERQTPVGVLRMLTPTDRVKDRLAAFFHWNDRQSLEQAIMVSRSQVVDISDVRDWAIGENNEPKFIEFQQRL
jgi:hypothetical protein